MWAIGTAQRLHVAHLPRPTTIGRAQIKSESHIIQAHVDLTRLMENIYAPDANSANAVSSPSANVFENPVALREEQLDDYIEFESLVCNDVKYRVGPHLSESERHAICDAADEFRPLWSLNKTDLGRIKGHEISVDIDGPPIRRAPYRLLKT